LSQTAAADADNDLAARPNAVEIEMEIRDAHVYTCTRLQHYTVTRWCIRRHWVTEHGGLLTNEELTRALSSTAAW